MVVNIWKYQNWVYEFQKVKSFTAVMLLFKDIKKEMTDLHSDWQQISKFKSNLQDTCN